MTGEKQKFCIDAVVTIGDKKAALGFDFNTVEVTEKKFDECCRAIIPGLAHFVRGEGKIVNPGVWD